MEFILFKVQATSRAQTVRGKRSDGSNMVKHLLDLKNHDESLLFSFSGSSDGVDFVAFFWDATPTPPRCFLLRSADRPSSPPQIRHRPKVHGIAPNGEGQILVVRPVVRVARKGTGPRKGTGKRLAGTRCSIQLPPNDSKWGLYGVIFTKSTFCSFGGYL